MNSVYKALADPTRREILLMLSKDSSNIGEISERFDMSRPAIAKHIKILEDAELVKIELDKQDGRQRNCYLQIEALKEVEDYINHLEKFWQRRLTKLGGYLKKEGNK